MKISDSHHCWCQNHWRTGIPNLVCKCRYTCLEFHQNESYWISAILWPRKMFYKPNFPFSMTIHGFMTFLLLHFVSSKGDRREQWQEGQKWAATASALSLKLMKFCFREKGGHTNGQIEQSCAINWGIQWNAAANTIITKEKNLFSFKSILKFMRFPRYIIGALILIGWLYKV